MIQERLNISKNAIIVQYRFLNESNHDILTTVAFPMPPYGWNPGVDASNIEGPLESFSVLIDGRKIKIKKQRRALIGQRDVTNQLRDAGLSDTQIFENFAGMTLEEGHNLSKQQAAKLTKFCALAGNAPTWKVAETAYWEQLFPSKKEIHVTHTYKPFVGMLYSVPYQGKQGFVSDIIPTILNKAPKEACHDKATRKALYRQIVSLVGQGASRATVWLDHIEYVLGTGRNWKGPISDFILTIEKESSDQIVSTCFPGKPKIVNPTTLEFRQRNYIPQDSLIVHFYRVTTE